MRKAARETTWDEGVIRTFMNVAGTRATTWIRGGHRLIVWHTERDAEIVASQVPNDVFGILEWLNVPATFNVVIWWRDDPRRISASEWPSKRTVNGGWTHSGGADTVYIYRSEDWLRVLLHELVHALEWDWAIPSKPLACWGLPTGSRLSPALFEAWTELMAEWLWCGWTEVPWEMQRAWQDWQAEQVLARARIRGGPWKEDTSVFAYYVLKAALAPNMPELLTQGYRGPEALCRASEEGLAALRRRAETMEPVAMSLCMTREPTYRRPQAD